VTDFATTHVIDALVTALQPLKSASPKAFVLDGPIRQWPKSDAVAIGLGRTVGASQQLPEEIRVGGRVGYQETVQVVCAAYSWVEPTDSLTAIKERRDRATNLVEAVDAVLTADPTLGGVCVGAHLGRTRRSFPRTTATVHG
jgi:hypothetical protein